jgi:hypothetical protein
VVDISDLHSLGRAVLPSADFHVLKSGGKADTGHIAVDGLGPITVDSEGFVPNADGAVVSNCLLAGFGQNPSAQTIASLPSIDLLNYAYDVPDLPECRQRVNGQAALAREDRRSRSRPDREKRFGQVQYP